MPDEHLPEAFAVVSAALFGLLCGSFLGVVAYRVPRGRSVVRPGSSCPLCGHELGWWENIPVASWLLLGRRCRACHAGISARYPAVELATGAAFAWVTWSLHAAPSAVGYCILAGTTIAIVLANIEGHDVPFPVAAVGSALALVALGTAAARSHDLRLLVGSVAGAAVGLIATAAIRASRHLGPDHEVMGRGMLVVVGCWLGGLPPVALTAGIATTAVGVPLVLAVEYLVVRRRVHVAGGVSATALQAQVGPTLLPLTVAAAMVVALAVGS